MFDFRRKTLFCLGYCFYKHKMTIYSKNLEGHAPLGYAYVLRHSSNDFEILYRTFRASISSFSGLRKLINAFPFFSSQQWKREPHKWISLGPRFS